LYKDVNQSTTVSPTEPYSVVYNLPDGVQTDLIIKAVIKCTTTYLHPTPVSGTYHYLQGQIEATSNSAYNATTEGDEARIIDHPLVWVAGNVVRIQYDRYTTLAPVSEKPVVLVYYKRPDLLTLSNGTTSTPALSQAVHMKIVELAYNLILAERYGAGGKEKKND